MGFLLKGNIILGQNQDQSAVQRQIITGNLDTEFTRRVSAFPTQTGLQHVAPINPVSSVSFTKVGDRIVRRGSMGGSLDISRSAPLFSDPRYTSSTLAIPTDDRTLHGLYRFFADTDPIVSAALRIHTELPLANLQLQECEDSGVQAHFEEMCDRINLIRTITDTVKEYWTIGNDYLFGAWNEKDYMWDQFTMLNPDYVKVESTWLNQKPLVKLIPDESLKKIVQSRSPEYLYKQLSPDIIRYVLYNNEIPLHANNTFIISHDKAPYEVKGKSIIKRLLKIMMYEDRLQQAQFAIATRHIVPLTVVKVGDPTTGWIPEQSELDTLREMFAAWELDPNFCYDEETECLTKDGWKHYTELTHDTDVASFNPKTNSLEYAKSSAINIQEYDGDMLHFESLGIDIKVTPNHRMWVKRGNEDWSIKLADQVERRDMFRAVVDSYKGDDLPEYLDIAGEKVKTEDWFEFAGWYLSEGSSYFDRGYDCHYSVSITQKKSSTQKVIHDLFKRLPWTWNLHGNNFTINGRELSNYIVSEFGKGSNNKSVPRWMLNASPHLLNKLLEAWLAGDGFQWQKKDGDTFKVGASVSKQLIDDMQEVAFKLGYATKVRTRTDCYRVDESGEKVYTRENGDKYYDVHILHISRGKKLSYPRVPRQSKQVQLDISINYDVPKVGKRVDWSRIKLQLLFVQCGGSASTVAQVLGVDKGTICAQLEKIGIGRKKAGSGKAKGGVYHDSEHILREQYSGKIWCVTVPTGIIVTRRNGKVAVQGQSIFYHYGINVEFYGSSGKILPTGPEFDRVYKLKFIGMGIHEQLMTGGGGSYAQAYANLEIQRQRYLNLQLKVEQLVHIGWFKTVSEMCGFYRMTQPVVGAYYRGKKYGSVKEAGKDLMSVYSGIRDYKDNEEFKEFFQRKAVELQNQELTQRREYVYPKLDWGAMSATNDENYKNWIKWLKQQVPWLVDEGTLARIARLDMKAQEKAFFRDIERRKARETELIRQGLAQWATPTKPGQGAPPVGGDFEGPGNMDIGPLTPGAPDLANIPAGGGLNAPVNAPVGAGGGPGGGPAATGGPPPTPSGPTASREDSDELTVLGVELFQDIGKEVGNTLKSTRAFNIEHAAIDREVGK